MKGNRSHQPKHLDRSRRTGRRRTQDGGDRALTRLVVCAAIFVLLVVVKLLLPGTVSTLAQSAGRLIGRDADFQAAFAAVGRAISGEEDVADSLQDAYAAVFNPTEPEEKRVISHASVKEVFAPANRLVQYVEKPFAAEQKASAEMAEPETVEGDSEEDETADKTTGETVTSQTLAHVYTMPTLPDNASLELRALGFDYTTPLRGTMTSPFGWREHPIQGEDKFHYGLDIAADKGTEICAFADGTVYATGKSSTLGNYIMLEHSGGYITLYAHCNRVTATSGNVKVGEKIAEVGETGVATGPHLHFELRDGELYLNPIYYVEIG